MAADTLTDDGRPRFVWEEVPVTNADWQAVVIDSLREHRRRRDQYEQAKQALPLAPTRLWTTVRQ